MLVCLSFLAFREDTAEQASERASLCHSSSSSDVFWRLAAESTENIRRSCIASLWIWRKHTVPREGVWHCMRKSGVAETGAGYV